MATLLGERRPIRARGWAPSRRAAGWLARRGVAPNAISIAGMVAGIAAGLALAATDQVESPAPWWLLSAALVVARLAANMLDGMVAEAAGRATPLGAIFNDVPDRVSDSATLIGLGHAAGGSPALGFVAALAAMFTAYVRAAGVAAGAPADFRGPMAKPHRMALVAAACIVAAVWPTTWLPAAALGVVAAGGILTAVRRLAGQARHLWGIP